MVAEEEEVVEAVEVPTVEAGAEWPGEDLQFSLLPSSPPHHSLHTLLPFCPNFVRRSSCKNENI